MSRSMDPLADRLVDAEHYAVRLFALTKLRTNFISRPPYPGREGEITGDYAKAILTEFEQLDEAAWEWAQSLIDVIRDLRDSVARGEIADVVPLKYREAS